MLFQKEVHRDALRSFPVPPPPASPSRTTAQRILRSLNSMAVVVADSAPAVRDVESTHSPAVLGRRR